MPSTRTLDKDHVLFAAFGGPEGYWQREYPGRPLRYGQLGWITHNQRCPIHGGETFRFCRQNDYCKCMAADCPGAGVIKTIWDLEMWRRYGRVDRSLLPDVIRAVAEEFHVNGGAPPAPPSQAQQDRLLAGYTPPAPEPSFHQRYAERIARAADLLLATPAYVARYATWRGLADDPTAVLHQCQVGAEITERGTLVFLFPAANEAGEWVGVKVRDPDTGNAWSFPGSQPGLFPRIAGELPPILHVGEGEPDVVMLNAAGFVAVCGSHGAGTWEASWCPALRGRGIRELTVVYDTDPAGRAGARKVVASALAAGLKGRNVDLGSVLGDAGKDVSDFFRLGHTLEELHTLIPEASLLEPGGAVEPGPPGGAGAGDADSGDAGGEAGGDTVAADPEWVSLEEFEGGTEDDRPAVVRPLLYRGQSTILGGHPKRGKSTLVTALTAAATGGPLFPTDPDTTEGFVDVFIAEEDVADFKRRAIRMGANVARIRVLKAEAQWTLTKLLDRLRTTDAVLVIVDACASFLLRCGLVVESGDPTRWTAFIQGATNAVRGRPTSLLFVHHARKADDELRDSTAIAASVDTVVLLRAIKGERRHRRLDVVGRTVPTQSPVVMLAEDETGYVLVSGDAVAERITRQRDSVLTREADLTAAIVRFLRDYTPPTPHEPPDPTTSQIGAAVHAVGGRDAVRRTLERLRRDGEVVNRALDPHGRKRRGQPDRWRLVRGPDDLPPTEAE